MYQAFTVQMLFLSPKQQCKSTNSNQGSYHRDVSLFRSISCL